MSDIVERLRNLNPWSELDWPECAREAADIIEALRKELDEERELFAIPHEIIKANARKAAIEECAKTAESHPGTNFTNAHGCIDWRVTSKHDAAAAIRALSDNAEGGKQ